MKRQAFPGAPRLPSGALATCCNCCRTAFRSSAASSAQATRSTRWGSSSACLYIVNSGFFKMVNLSGEGREQVVGLHFKGDWMGLDGHRRGAVRLRRGRDGHRRGLGHPLRRSCCQAAVRTPALLTALHEAMSRRTHPRSRFDAVAVHAARRRARGRLPALLGRRARAARPAHRPDHAAHDACRDRQLPRHDAGVGEPGAVAAGARRRDPLHREGPARHPHSAGRGADALHAARPCR